MLKMYSPSEYSACSMAQFYKSFFMSFEIAFSFSSWQKENSGGSVF